MERSSDPISAVLSSFCERALPVVGRNSPESWCGLWDVGADVWETVSALPEYSQAIDVLKSDPDVMRDASAFPNFLMSRHGDPLPRVLRQCLGQVVHQVAEREDQGAAISGVAEGVAEYFRASTLSLVGVSALYDLEPPAEPLDLEAGLSLEAMAPRWSEYAPRFMGEAQAPVGRVKCALVQRNTIEKSNAYDPTHRERFTAADAIRFWRDIVVGLMHLVQPHPVWCWSTMIVVEPNPFGYLGIEGGPPTSDLFWFGGRDAHHADPRIVGLCRQWYSLAEHEAGRLFTALKRLVRGRWTNDQKSALVDYFIGMESLYLSQNDRAGKSDGLATRAALFLESGVDARKELHDLIRAAYRARNNIVHEGRQPSQVVVAGRSVHIVELAARIRDVLQRSITEYLAAIEEHRYMKSDEYWIKRILS